MTAFVLVYPLAFTALLAVLMASMTTLTPPELPLGVRVPNAHANDPVVRRAVLRFRIAQGLAWLVAAIVTLSFASAYPVVAVAAPILLFVALSVLSLVAIRREIVRAKREEDWFAGVPVRVRADVSAPTFHRPPIIWPILGAVALAAAVGIGVAVYARLPDPLPIHYDAAGHVDGLAPKSVWSVFGVLMIGAAVWALLAALSFVAARMQVRLVPGDDADQARARAAVQRGVLASLLAELSFVVPLGISALEVASWLAPGGTVTRWAAIGLGLLTVLLVLSAVVRTRRVLSVANRRDPGRSGATASGAPGSPGAPDAPDDDAHWKGGIFYVNRDDPSVWVPRRFGLGWTINLGRPIGMLIGVLLILAIVGAVVSAIVGVRVR